jgi:sulfite reductase (ferredoxin)
VDEEKKALSYKTFEIDTTAFEVEIPEPLLSSTKVSIDDKAAFDAWKKSNVIPQTRDM